MCRDPKDCDCGDAGADEPSLSVGHARDHRCQTAGKRRLSTYTTLGRRRKSAHRIPDTLTRWRRFSSPAARDSSGAGAWSSCCGAATGCARPFAISPASRRCGPGSSSEVDAGDRLSFLAADLRADDGWEQAVARLRLRPARRLAVPAGAAEGPRRADRPRPRRNAAGAAAQRSTPVPSRIVVTSSVAAVGGGTDAASAPLTEADWTDLDNPKLTPYARSKTIAERAAWDLVARAGRGRAARLRQPRRDPRPRAERRPLLLARADRAAAEGHARRAADRLQHRRRPRRRRPADQGDDRRRRPAASASSRSAGSPGCRRSPRCCATASGTAAAKVPTRNVPDLLVRAMGIFDPGVRSIVGQLGRKVEMSSEKAEARSAGRPARSRRRSPTAAAAWSMRKWSNDGQRSLRALRRSGRRLPAGYARDDVPTIERYPGGQTTPTPEAIDFTPGELLGSVSGELGPAQVPGGQRAHG